LSDGHIAIRRTIAVVLIGLGAVIAVGARLRWRQIDRAMRRGDPLPGTYLGPLIAGTMVGVGVMALILVFLI
jgi:inner membrane protein YidH